ncbi:MAG: helix-turn-helix domain-containing protein [Flavobacteriales bacterium]|nr:helix-turn-helix domain-containing protein [Flavobacteriales bacterium]
MTKIRDEQLLQAFGERVRSLRIERNLSQYELADTANISRSQVKGIEKGDINPSLCTMAVLADAFNITTSELTDF